MLLTRDDLRRQSPLAWVLLTALIGVAAALHAMGRQNAAHGTALAWIGCVALILPPRERMAVLPPRLRALPRICDSAPVLATLLSVPGYGVGWFYGANPYDETVHLVSGALFGAVLGALLLADGQPRPGRRVGLTGLGIGLVLAVGWEGFEWATGLIGNAVDTGTDILLTAGGSALGALLAWRAWGRAARGVPRGA